MKRFKIGFLAIVAILAMSFTIASTNGAFKNTKAAPAAATDCYSSIRVAGVDYVQGSFTTCPDLDGQCLQAATSLIDPEVACPGDPEQFCCAQIVAESGCSNITPTNLPTGSYKVATIFCYDPNAR
jgi:hypothetical protein